MSLSIARSLAANRHTLRASPPWTAQRGGWRLDVGASQQQLGDFRRRSDHCIVPGRELRIPPRCITLQTLGELSERPDCRIVAVDISAGYLRRLRIRQPNCVELAFERMRIQPRTNPCKVILGGDAKRLRRNNAG